MAISLDYGKCNGCGKEQSKTLENCRQCGAALPWNKGAMKIQNSSSASPKMGIADIAWAAMGVQALGGLLFVAGIAYRIGSGIGFLPRIPFLTLILVLAGVGLWGVGSRME